MGELNKYKVIKRAIIVFLFFFVVITFFVLGYFVVQENMEIETEMRIDEAIVNTYLEDIQVEITHSNQMNIFGN